MKKNKFFVLLMIAGLMITACVKDEAFQEPPVISTPELNPPAPGVGDAVLISVEVTNNTRIKSVKLYYNPGQAAFTEVLMTATGDVYTATIPGQDSNVMVNYYLLAENESGLKAYYPSGAPTSTASYKIGSPLIVMNEIYSNGSVEEPDWIEIYNDSEEPVDISGFKIYDSGGQSGTKPKLLIPDGTMVPAKGFYVMVVDVEGESGFGLSSAGEEVWFENAGGNIIDNITFPALNITQSYGRNPDGSSTWETLNLVTRGTPNSNTEPQAIILMNEIFSQGNTENPDWIELYNASDFDANLSGYKIYDSSGQTGARPKKEIPEGTIIASHSWIYVVVNDGTESGFDLSANGQEVWIENAANLVLDHTAFPALEATQSYGRYPDGSDNWQVLFVVTQGTANDNTVPPPTDIVLMNEIYSRGTAEDPDWIEIFNPGTTELNIGGYKIYDNAGQTGTKPKKEFPAGTIIPPGGWYVIVVDDEEASGFGLGSGGETVWFENNVGVIIDSIAFPALEVEQSYGRYPDGTANWQVLFVVTKGAANDNSGFPLKAGSTMKGILPQKR